MRARQGTPSNCYQVRRPLGAYGDQSRPGFKWGPHHQLFNVRVCTGRVRPEGLGEKHTHLRRRRGRRGAEEPQRRNGGAAKTTAYSAVAPTLGQEGGWMQFPDPPVLPGKDVPMGAPNLASMEAGPRCDIWRLSV